MHSLIPFNASMALRETFIHAMHLPSLISSRSTARNARATLQRQLPALPHRPVRHYAGKYRPPVGRLYNELIKSPTGFVDLVEDDGRCRKHRLGRLLSDLDRKNQRIVQVRSAEENENGAIPVCKIVSSKDEFEKGLKQKGPKYDPQANAKTIELRWSCEQKDLEHRLQSLKGFLEEGKAVELEIRHRKRGRPVSEAEGQTLLRTISEVALAVPDVRIWREPEGTLLKMMKLSFLPAKRNVGGERAGQLEDRQARVNERNEAKKEVARKWEERVKEKHEEERRQLEEFLARKRAEREQALRAVAL